MYTPKIRSWMVVVSWFFLLCASCATGSAEVAIFDPFRCGDGLLDESNDEECDDGNLISGDGCSIDCILEAGGSDNTADDTNGSGGASAEPSSGGEAPEESGDEEPAGEVFCEDTLDNDNDNAIDCEDTDCDGQICGAHGLTCQGGQCECPGGESTESNCADSIDGDCDGDTDCDDSDCASDPVCEPPLCASPIAIQCGADISSTTAGGPTNISSMGCNSIGTPGPEAYYMLNVSTPKTVTVTLDGAGTKDLDLAIVGTSGKDCDPQNQCIAWGWGGTNNEEESFSAAANTTYFIIVESQVSVGNNFSLKVTCN